MCFAWSTEEEMGEMRDGCFNIGIVSIGIDQLIFLHNINVQKFSQFLVQ